MAKVSTHVRRWLSHVPLALPVARLTLETIRICLRYRVTGLASEAGFFALLSLPPLVLGLFGGVGYVGQWVGSDSVATVRAAIDRFAAQFLTPDVIDSTLAPTVDDVLRGGRFDLISLGFVLSLWSGSRALNVFVDTISIMYGQSGVRGIVQTRALSFSLYVIALIVGVLTIPLVLIGPTWLGQILPEQLEFLVWFYWPVVSLVTVASLASLYHVSTPIRSPWLHDVPGAGLTLVIWAIASFVVRGTIAASLGGVSIYGPLSAPIVLLIWLYALAIAVLIGAALNAAIRVLWPSDETRGLRERALAAVRSFRAGGGGDADAAGAPAVGAGGAAVDDAAAGGDSRAGEDAVRTDGGADDVADLSHEGAEDANEDEDTDDLGFARLAEAAHQPLTPFHEHTGQAAERVTAHTGRGD